MICEKYLIIEVLTDYDPIIRNLTRYESYFNNFLVSKVKGEISIEVISNGILYIFKRCDVLSKALDLFDEFLNELKEEDEGRKKKRKKAFSRNILMENVIKKREFPADGIKFSVRIINPENVKKEFYERYTPEFIRNLLIKISNDMIIKFGEPEDDKVNDIVIRFPNYDSIYRFTSVIYNFDYSKIIKNG